MKRRWREDLRDALEEGVLAHTWERVVADHAARSRRAGWWRVGAVTAIAIAMLALWTGPAHDVERQTPPPRIGPVAREGGEALGHIAPGEHVALDDGSRIDTGDDGEIETLVDDAQAVVLHLVRGGARFSVHPGGPRRWRIEGGGVTVEVVGTELSVARDGPIVRVRVEHGVVLVRGDHVPDGVQRVAAGESITVDPTPPHEASPPSVAVERPRPMRRDTISSAQRMLDEADRARREGRASDALDILERIAREHPSAPEAPFATLDRARLLLRLGRTRDARDALDVLLAQPLPASLRSTVEAVRETVPEVAP